MDELDFRVNQLKKLIYADMNHPKVRILAQQITRGYNTNQGKARAIYNWIKQNIHYTRDADGLDIYTRPSMLIELGRGDCDDSAALFSSLAGIVGVPTKLKVITQDQKVWSHIYPLSLNGKWLAYDAAAPVPMEQEVRYLDSRIYDV